MDGSNREQKGLISGVPENKKWRIILSPARKD
jgi:hypothetical protein